MITLSIPGFGLGNQMFLYAYGRYLSEKYHISIQLYYEEHMLEHNATYENTLKNYNISIKHVIHNSRYYMCCGMKLFFLQHQLKKYTDMNINMMEKYVLLEREYHGKLLKHHIVMNYDAQSPNIYNIRNGKNILVKGYFQNKYYAEQIRDILLKEFIPKSAAELQKLDVYKEIIKENSVCVHIRRGDYVNNALHLVCDEDYYINAMKQMSRQLLNPVYYVFSDDISYAKDTLKLEQFGEVIYASDLKLRDYEELYLMSCCNNFIISNSSFSWWAQFLSKNMDKIVIAPKRWYGVENMEGRLFQNNWQYIGNNTYFPPIFNLNFTCKILTTFFL